MPDNSAVDGSSTDHAARQLLAFGDYVDFDDAHEDRVWFKELGVHDARSMLVRGLTDPQHRHEHGPSFAEFVNWAEGARTSEHVRTQFMGFVRAPGAEGVPVVITGIICEPTPTVSRTMALISGCEPDEFTSVGGRLRLIWGQP